MNKLGYKDAISKIADEKGLTLPKSWQNKSEENLRLMLDELQNGEFDSITESANTVEETKEEIRVQVGEENLSIGEINRINKSFLKRLQQEEYVDIEIDPTPMYPEGSTVPIGLNGVVFRVPVGMPFEKGVPKSIKAVYDYSKRETRKANNAMKAKLKGEIKIQ